MSHRWSPQTVTSQIIHTTILPSMTSLKHLTLLALPHLSRRHKDLIIHILLVSYCAFINMTPTLIHHRTVGLKTDCDGNPLPPDTPPPTSPPVPNVWAPFDGEVQFRLADFLFRKVEMSQGDINALLDLWSLDMHRHGDDAPFSNHQALYQAIDEIRMGSAPWKCFETVVPEDLGRDAPEWQRRSYQIWFRDPDVVISNILADRDFEKEFDPAPYVDLDADGQRRWSDFMSGNYAWRHAICQYIDDSLPVY